MTRPAARLTDLHMCIAPAPPPATPLPPPGVPNTIDAPGATTVLIGGLPAARAIVDQSLKGVPHPIVTGSATVMIQMSPAARVGDTLLVCGGAIIPPCMPNVLIGG